MSITLLLVASTRKRDNLDWSQMGVMVVVDRYSKEQLMGFLNNPTRHGLWNLEVTIDDVDTFYNGLVKRDATFKDFPPIPSWLVGICLSQLTTVIAGKEDPDAALMRRVGLIQLIF